MQNIKEMDVQELYELMNAEKDNGDSLSFRFIDVRTTAEVARGKIEKGENIPLHLIPLKIEELRTEDKLIIYCRTGARSAQACGFLASNGIENAINVRGGIVAWAQQGYPITN